MIFKVVGCRVVVILKNKDNPSHPTRWKIVGIIYSTYDTVTSSQILHTVLITTTHHTVHIYTRYSTRYKYTRYLVLGGTKQSTNHTRTHAHVASTGGVVEFYEHLQQPLDRNSKTAHQIRPSTRFTLATPLVTNLFQSEIGDLPPLFSSFIIKPS